MKPQLIIAFALAIIFTACQRESGFEKPYSIFSSHGSTHDPAQYIDAHEIPDDLSSFDYCLVLNTNHTLVATTRFEPLRASSEISEVSGTTGLYYIEATGTGTSDDFGECQTELNLIFNTRTNFMTGVITSTFPNGIILEQVVDNDVRYLPDTRSMTLVVKLNDASFTTDMEILNLVHGQVTFSLPVRLSRRFDMQLYSIGMFCSISE